MVKNTLQSYVHFDGIEGVKNDMKNYKNIYELRRMCMKIVIKY